MLSRTADNLFWLSRYVERADYLARILEATSRLSVLPAAYAGDGNEWTSALATAGCLNAFLAQHEKPTAETVTNFLAFSEQNPSSIRRCLETARFNARAVRTALTQETWETINGAWLELQKIGDRDMASGGASRFTEWVKDVSLRIDGSGYRTMLRNDAYWFSRLGFFIERADNTARILDVKYHILLPESSNIGGGLDYSQWAAILRSVNALTAYRWVYRESLKPWLIADLLILNEELPRSLAACYKNIVDCLDSLGTAYGRQGKSQRQARTVYTALENCTIEQIFQTGLHEFLTSFVADNNRLGAAIVEQYLSAAMRIRIQHRTAYIYDQPASSIIQVLRLTPRNFEGQRVRAWRIELDQDVHMQSGEDAFGNVTHSLSFTRPLDDLAINVRGEVETQDVHGIVRGAVERFPPGLYLRETPLTQPNTDLRAFAHDVGGEGDALGRLHNLLDTIHQTFTFETGLTDAHTTAVEAFALKKGVCQDFAHVFIAAARALGIPARYIGGYLLRSDGENRQEAAHAWAEAHVEGLGWIGFDPANGISPSESHIRVGMALDYLGAAPIRGSHRGGGEERLEVFVLTDSQSQTQSQS